MRAVSIVSALCAFSIGNAIAFPQYRQYTGKPTSRINVQLGPRPYYLVDDMDEGPLKDQLNACREGPIKTSSFSIGHRGAPLQFPEHSNQSYHAAARMGAGVIECDVAFTSDRQLVCRHDQCDLHTTTNILTIPELASKCNRTFTPYDPATGKAADAYCCTSDITLAEFKTLCGKMDASFRNATTPEEYQGGTPDWRTDLYATCGTVMTHKESIALIDSFGLEFTPELKTPIVAMPYQGNYTQEDYAQQMLDEYKEAGINPSRVWPQSFLLDDILYWIRAEPEFAKQAVYLDDEVDTDPEGAIAVLPQLAEQGVVIVAPAFYALLNVTANGTIVPSEYALTAQASNLSMISWSLERSGPIVQVVENEDYYYSSILTGVNNDGDIYTVVDVLAQQVGILKLFSDWPATVTYYANCFGL